MNWSSKEKYALLKSICFLIGANKRDLQNKQMEVFYFIRKLDLDDAAMLEQANMDQNEMESIIRRMSNSNKEIVKTYWRETITRDNLGDSISDREIGTWIMMAENCGINIED
ncbi:MAG: hypothetical protein LUC86_05600 [Prevotellaceae bacterium]|nr:hypothetical protein [Prevotellaceae bacterium]